MRLYSVLVAAVMVLTACSRNEVFGPGTSLGAPLNLRYQLVPSGDPNAPEGILLQWEDPGDTRITSFVVYSRGSVSDQWSRRAQTTSLSFHDVGIPHLQYFVASVDDAGNESAGSNAITVDERNRLPFPAGLISISLDRAIQLSWSDNARQTDPNLFDYYRVYSTHYDLDADVCDGTRWVLEGTTVSEDFLATGLTNGVPRCFAVSTVSRDGHESVWPRPRADTPRYDSRNILIFARQVSSAQSGFRFQFPGGAALGAILDGGRVDIDFYVDRRSDGSLWLTPVRTGTRIALYSTTPVADLTSIDIAPASGFSAGAIEAVPGYAYVFETLLADGLHYGGVRMTHVGLDYAIFDWSYQSDAGNPELRRTGVGSW